MRDTVAKTKAEIQRDYAKRSGYAAQKKYNANNTVEFRFRCMKTTEADIIEQLEKQPNKSGYIKSLIRQDIKN